ncbi:MAG TPA: GtrA family protein, partial [Bryobacteraceae bacterium]
MDFATKPADDVAAERSGRLNALRSEFLRYIVVGGLAFLVDAGTLFLLTALAHVPYLVSAAAGFLLGLVANYVLSRRWVFRNRTLSSTAVEFTVFTLIGLVGLGLN